MTCYQCKQQNEVRGSVCVGSCSCSPEPYITLLCSAHCILAGTRAGHITRFHVAMLLNLVNLCFCDVQVLEYLECYVPTINFRRPLHTLHLTSTVRRIWRCFAIAMLQWHTQRRSFSKTVLRRVCQWTC